MRIETPESLAGAVLIAHPVLKDPNFRRTAVLMSSHSPEGAMGVVLNRPLGKRLGEFKGDFALGPLARVPMFTGGPVQNMELLLVAWKTRKNAFQLYFGIDPDKAIELMGEESIRVHAYLGCSGWSAGQLENELRSGTWIVTGPPADLFERPMEDSLWGTLLAREGDQWRLLAEEPEEPGEN